VDIPFGAPEPVVASVQQATQAMLDLGLKPLMLGGEHLISSGARQQLLHLMMGEPREPGAGPIARLDLHTKRSRPAP
jgi:hypothetical protein